MRSLCVLMVVAVTVAVASVTAYHIEPRTAAMSGKVRGDPQYGGVSQTVTCNFDSLSYIELFAGAKGNGGTYTATVYDGSSPIMSSNGSQDWDNRWVRFKDWNTQAAFTKGKTLTITFTRSGNDSIEYYYSGGDPYPYGAMLVPGQGPTDRDLACRHPMSSAA